MWISLLCTDMHRSSFPRQSPQAPTDAPSLGTSLTFGVSFVGLTVVALAAVTHPELVVAFAAGGLTAVAFRAVCGFQSDEDDSDAVQSVTAEPTT